MNKLCLWSVVAAALFGASAVSAQQAAAPAAGRMPAVSNACVGATFRANVASCPATRQAIRDDEARTARVAVTAVGNPAAAAAAAQTGPSQGTYELDESTLRNVSRRDVRALELLNRETEILKRLATNTRTDDPQRPEVLLRLAETYFEQQQAITVRIRAFDQPKFEACEGTTPNPQTCQRITAEQAAFETQMNASRQAAVRAYAQLIQDHPNFRRLDEVLFSLAYTLEEIGQQDQARTVYGRLIQNFPESRFIPNAYLSFGEFYFNSGDMSSANQFYDRVVQYPPERNSVYGYALYKSAWAFYNLEDFRGSLQRFAEVIEFATQNPNAFDGQNLARQARRELVQPYARVGTPERALEFFGRYATNRDQSLEMLESLAELYYDTGQWDKTITTYHKLMAESPNSDKLCVWESKVAHAVIAQGNKRATVEELRRLVQIYEGFVGQTNRPEAARNECKAGTAGVLFQLATSWHIESVGNCRTEDERGCSQGTQDRETMGKAAELYELLLRQFPDMERLQFPDIQRDSWPSRYRIAYYMADLSYRAEQWERCGPAFEAVIELNPTGEFTNDAAHSAVLCYNRLYNTTLEGNEGRVRQAAAPGAAGTDAQSAAVARREMTTTEAGMLRAFSNYVCVATDASERLPQIKFRRARIYYETNQFEEAALLFQEIAFTHRDTEYGIPAANLYLDSLNTLATLRAPNNPECLGDFENVLDPFNAMYCSTPEVAARSEGLCGVLADARCVLKRRRAEALSTSGRHLEAAYAYRDLFRENARMPEDQRCGSMPEILWNMGIEYEAAHLVGRAIRAFRVLIQAFPEDALAKRAIYRVGAAFHALARYEEAATYYEQFARTYPQEAGAECTQAERDNGSCAIASDALMNATLFRLGMGQEEQAIANADLFQRNYERRMPRETAQVRYAIGALYEHRNQHGTVILYYRRFLRDYARIATVHQQILAQVTIGRAYLREDPPKPSDAKTAFEAAVRLWNGGAMQQINRMEVPAAEKLRMTRETIDAVAEALFNLAESKYRAFEAIEFPRYSGGRSLERVNAWAQGEFVRWMGQKTAALTAATNEYNKIAALRVPVEGGVELFSAPWQIAGAARIGQMYRSFVDLFRSAPIPAEIENDYELYAVYTGRLDELSQPLLDQAIDKFKYCLLTATNVRWFNEWSRICETELNGLNPREYPIAAELRGQPNLALDTPGRPAAIELGSGVVEEEEVAAPATPPAAGAQGGAQ
jgi:tetratricopeptide (TPR) repeat protein